MTGKLAPIAAHAWDIASSLESGSIEASVAAEPRPAAHFTPCREQNCCWYCRCGTRLSMNILDELLDLGTEYDIWTGRTAGKETA